MIVRILLSRTLGQYANVEVEADTIEAAEQKIQDRLNDIEGGGWEQLLSALQWEDGGVEVSAYISDSEALTASDLVYRNPDKEPLR